MPSWAELRCGNAIFTPHSPGYFASKAREDAKNCNGIANAVDTCTMQTIARDLQTLSATFSPLPRFACHKIFLSFSFSFHFLFFGRWWLFQVFEFGFPWQFSCLRRFWQHLIAFWAWPKESGKLDSCQDVIPPFPYWLPFDSCQ